MVRGVLAPDSPLLGKSPRAAATRHVTVPLQEGALHRVLHEWQLRLGPLLLASQQP